MVFYNPFTMELGGKPAIVYPSEGLDTVFNRHAPGGMNVHIRALHAFNQKLIPRDVEYFLAILWNEGDNRMTDLRVNRRTKTYAGGRFGYLGNVLTFRNFDNYKADPKNLDDGDTCGNEDIVVGLEEKHRRLTSPNDVRAFVSGPRPELPEWLKAGEDFYSIG